MPARSVKLEDKSGRFRTLLQSIDTARYHDDRKVDRKVDIDQARTEILSAVLFGHEIIIPAGVVADCPAVYQLLPEVLHGFEWARKRIHEKSGRRYFPFRIGVERRFAEQDPQGYDAFIRDYIAYEQRRIAPNIELGRTEERPDAATRTKTHIEMLAEAFLARDWSAIRHVDARYADYFEFIYQNFVEQNDRTPRPVTARDGALTQVPKEYYSRFVSRCCKNLEVRGVEYDHIQLLRSQTNAMRRRMSENDIDPGQRGSWYGRREEYEERWDDVRVWFDHALYGRMASAFGVQIPSFFTQELSDGSIQRNVSLAFLDHGSLKAFAGNIAQGKPPLPPAASEVDWPSIWQLVAEDEVQTRILSLHHSIRDARDVFREERRALSQKDRNTKERRTAQLHTDYRNRSFEAIERHIQFLNSGQSGFRFKQHNGRLLVDAASAEPAKSGATTLVKNMISAGFGEATSAITHGTPGLIVAPAAVAGAYVSDKLGDGVDRVLDYFSRPAGDSKKAQDDFFSAERARVNFWFSNV